MGRKKKTETNQTNIKPSEQGSFVYAHGRRKTATARVRLDKDGGQIMVNQKPGHVYFPTIAAGILLEKPFKVTRTVGKFSANVKVEGSGKSGQLEAVVHGLARALLSVDPQFKPQLKAAGLLTRDPRAKERRKYGLAQKARKGKQSPKR